MVLEYPMILYNVTGIENVCLITIAPELEGAMEAIQSCVEHGVIVSVGHTTAELPQVNLFLTSFSES